MNSSAHLNLPDAHLDLRGTPCPINFVRTKLRLEQMAPGALLEVWLDSGEPVEQVPDSLTMEGYILEKIEQRQDKTFDDKHLANKVIPTPQEHKFRYLPAVLPCIAF